MNDQGIMEHAKGMQELAERGFHWTNWDNLSIRRNNDKLSQTFKKNTHTKVYSNAKRGEGLSSSQKNASYIIRKSPIC